MELEKIPILIDELTARINSLELRLSQVTKPEPERPCSIDDAAAFLGLSRQSVYQLSSKRLIPTHKAGKRLFFFKTELSDYVRAKKRKVIS